MSFDPNLIGAVEIAEHVVFGGSMSYYNPVSKKIQKDRVWVGKGNPPAYAIVMDMYGMRLVAFLRIPEGAGIQHCHISKQHYAHTLYCGPWPDQSLGEELIRIAEWASKEWKP